MVLVEKFHPLCFARSLLVGHAGFLFGNITIMREITSSIAQLIQGGGSKSYEAALGGVGRQVKISWKEIL